MVLITVLIKRDQEIGFVTGREHFARTDADLEDGRSARNGGGNRHVSHDVLIAASSEPGEKRARGLNSVLRIAGEPDDCVLNIFRSKIGAVRARLWDGGYIGINGIAHGGSSILRGKQRNRSRAWLKRASRGQRTAVRGQRSDE